MSIIPGLTWQALLRGFAACLRDPGTGRLGTRPGTAAWPAACRAGTTVDGALKLYIRDPSAPPLTWQGDHELADALAGAKAILG